MNELKTVCKYCQQEFTPNINQIYCSKSCQRTSYYQANKELIKKTQSLYVENNYIKVQCSRAKYRSNNPEKIKAMKDAWKAQNPNYRKDKYQRDIQHRIAEKIRTKTRKILLGMIKDQDRCMAFLGTNTALFRKHIESQFTAGMSWDNYGKDGWTLDHVIPLNMYDLTKPKEYAKATNYKNTRPLWAKQNQSRSKN